MLFHEVYGTYYHTVAEIVSKAVMGELTEDALQTIVIQNAFQESFLEIPPALKAERWPLLLPDLSTPLQHIPTTPLTTLQLRWLKAISLDKRICLFDVNFEILDGIQPLFTPDDYVVFDQYQDGDPFASESYVRVFRMLLLAIREHKKVRVKYNSRKGMHRYVLCDPYKLEYSEKDDKFRVHVNSCRPFCTMNLAGIEQCEIVGDAYPVKRENAHCEKTYFAAVLYDERNAMERFLLHFSHFQKETEQIGGEQYFVKVYYDVDEETEVLIRVLSFGPFLKVKGPDHFVSLIVERLKMQKSCGLK